MQTKIENSVSSERRPNKNKNLFSLFVDLYSWNPLAPSDLISLQCSFLFVHRNFMQVTFFLNNFELFHLKMPVYSFDLHFLVVSIFSPRDSTGGLGVKMVEYVLGGSPTNKESPLSTMESRLRGLKFDENDKVWNFYNFRNLFSNRTIFINTVLFVLIFSVSANSQTMIKKRKIHHLIQMAWKKMKPFQMAEWTAWTTTWDSSKLKMQWVHSIKLQLNKLQLHRCHWKKQTKTMRCLD